MFLAEDVLGSDENVEAIGADESDDDHADEPIEPAGVVESFVHGKNSSSETSLEQMCERFGVSRGGD
jgi:hypothetical protein